MTIFDRRSLPSNCCWTFARAPTRQEPFLEIGIARIWSGTRSELRTLRWSPNPAPASYPFVPSFVIQTEHWQEIYHGLALLLDKACKTAYDSTLHELQEERCFDFRKLAPCKCRLTSGGRHCEPRSADIPSTPAGRDLGFGNSANVDAGGSSSF